MTTNAQFLGPQPEPQVPDTASHAQAPAMDTANRAQAMATDTARHTQAPTTDTARHTQAPAMDTARHTQAPSMDTARHARTLDAAPERGLPGDSCVEAWADTIVSPETGTPLEGTIVDMSRYATGDAFFADSLLGERAPAPADGVVGAPVPYSIKGDSAISAMMLACFMLVLVGLSKAGKYMQRIAKGFLGDTGRLTSGLSETTGEFRLQFFMVFQTCLLLSILTFTYTRELTDTTLTMASNHRQMAVFLVVFIAYFTLKALLYWGVNSVFFDSRSNGIWLRFLLFAFAMEGFALFPLVVLHAYLDLPAKSGLPYLAAVFALMGALRFSRSYALFFRQKPPRLQIILYFCALELMPILLLWGTLVTTVGSFKI